MMRPKKSLGQNFLRDESVIERIVEALELKENETVIEIGPGEGALTARLVSARAHVLAIEIDTALVRVLKTQFQSYHNFRVIEADVLTVDFEREMRAIERRSVTNNRKLPKLVGNLPYYISTAILQKLVAERALFSKIVLMLQREVAQRVTALPGSSERGFLTVLIEAAFTVDRLFDVPPTAFYPQPKVWSSVVILKPKANSFSDASKFIQLISAAFAQKRKTITNNLKHIRSDVAPILHKANIDARRRAETLTLDEWLRLYDAFTKNYD